jgi:hypothetical protein
MYRDGKAVCKGRVRNERRSARRIDFFTGSDLGSVEVTPR